MTDGFAAILQEMQDMHERKSKDYGSEEDPLSNIRASEQFGIPAWVGAILRGNDKMVRLKTFVKKGKLENESVEDSLLDLAVYATIALQLYREAQQIKAQLAYNQELAGVFGRQVEEAACVDQRNNYGVNVAVS